MDLDSLEQFAGVNLEDVDLTLAIDSYMNSPAAAAVVTAALNQVLNPVIKHEQP